MPFLTVTVVSDNAVPWMLILYSSANPSFVMKASFCIPVVSVLDALPGAVASLAGEVSEGALWLSALVPAVGVTRGLEVPAAVGTDGASGTADPDPK